MKPSEIISTIALITSLSSTPTLAQKSTLEMSQQEIQDRVAELCRDPKILARLAEPNESCEYPTDVGVNWWNVAGGASVIALIGLGAIFGLRKKEEVGSMNLYTYTPITNGVKYPDIGKINKSSGAGEIDTIISDSDFSNIDSGNPIYEEGIIMQTTPPSDEAREENIKPIRNTMPGIEKPAIIQLERRGFEVVKDPLLGVIHIRVIRDGRSLGILNENNESTEEIGLNHTYTIDSSVLNVYLDYGTKKLRIRLEGKNGKKSYIQING